MATQEIFIESKRIGNALRVAAIDASTGTEVIFQAPLHTSRRQLEKLAVSKLRYVMNKEEKK